MGTRNFAIMLGVPGDAGFLKGLDFDGSVIEVDGEPVWKDGLIEAFDEWQDEHVPEEAWGGPEFDENGGVFGIIVLCSARGETHALDCPLDLLSFSDMPAYEVPIRKARSTWKWWTDFLATHNVKDIPEPRFYLVRTETA